MADSRRSPVRLLLVLIPVPAALAAGQLLSFIGTNKSMPVSVAATGLVLGAANALLVVGLILVYRAARIINFAHTAVGFLAVMGYLFLRVIYHWSFFLTVPVILVGAGILGAALELAVIRRFSRAPRLVLTVVTIALGQLIVSIALSLVPWQGYKKSTELPPIPPSLPWPNLRVQWGPQVWDFSVFFTIAVVVAMLGALAVFFRFSTTGIAIRGAAENRARAGLLGVNVNTLSSLVWAVAGVLAAAGSLLVAMLQKSSLPATAGAAAGAAFGGGVLLRALAAAVIARMEKLPTAIAAALAISVIDQAVFWSFHQSTIIDLVLLLGIVVALLAQRRGFSRADVGVSGTWEAAEELQATPAVLASLPTVRRTTRRFVYGLAVVLLAFPWVMSPSQTLQGSLFAIYGIVVVSLVVLTGWGGQISLGQFGFVAVGALVGGALTAKAGVPFLLAAVAACAAGAVAAVIVGLPALRIQGLFLAVTSLGFAVVAQTVLLSDRWFGGVIPSRVTRPKLFGIDMNTNERAFYYLCLLALGGAILVASGLRRTRTGRVLIAMRDNERAAQSFGISLVRTRLTTFAIAGGLGGLAGILFANHQYSVTANAFGPDQSIFVFLMAVMGGLGSVFGVLLGVLYFGLSRVVIPDVGGQLLASSFGVLIVLISFPGGLGSLAYRARDAWLRRIALRYRIFVPTLFGVERRLAEEMRLVPIAPPLDDSEPVPSTYTLPSLVLTAGTSQQARPPTR